jgi:molybdopterin/thiamine biosynthesis adenylyltransferase
MRLLLEQPVRMLAETRGLDALAAATDWLTRLEWGLTAAGDVRVNVDLTVQGKVYEAELVYPSLFPQAPAYVRPRKPDEAWSAHQYPSTGTLCLEWGPDNWHTGVTGVDLVVSAHKLLAFERYGPALGLEAPSRHELTLGQRARSQVCRFVVTPQLAAAVRAAAGSTFTALTVATTARFTELVAFATKVGDDAAPTPMGVPRELADPMALGSWIRNGWLIRCDEWASLPKLVTTQSVVREFLKAKGCWPWQGVEEQAAFLLLADENLRLRPISVSKGEGNTATEYFAVDHAADNPARQPERNLGLAQKKVAIVGLGSVGSKVAVSLARSSVARFLLVDDDIVQPPNLVRNQLDWHSVGYDKVDAVKGAIQLVQPDAEVTCRSFRFAGQESASYNTTVLEQLAACDLVIDATASPKVFSSIAAICERRRVALVWGEVFAGGIGALMARSLPGRDAGPLDVRAAIHEYLARQPEAPFRRAPGYDVEADEEVFVAGDAEVSQLAAALTQFSIDALVETEGYRFPVAAYLLGFKRAWIFEAPFDTHPIDCPRAAVAPATQEDAEANASAIGELLTVLGEKQC